MGMGNILQSFWDLLLNFSGEAHVSSAFWVSRPCADDQIIPKPFQIKLTLKTAKQYSS